MAMELYLQNPRYLVKSTPCDMAHDISIHVLCVGIYPALSHSMSLLKGSIQGLLEEVKVVNTPQAHTIILRQNGLQRTWFVPHGQANANKDRRRKQTMKAPSCVRTRTDPVSSKNKHRSPNVKAKVSTSELLSTSACPRVDYSL